jgi:glycosyltransferase involved in cell wall biosynthesis
VNAITRIRKDARLAKRLAARARADVANFTWTARAERLETLFAAVAGGRT